MYYFLYVVVGMWDDGYFDGEGYLYKLKCSSDDGSGSGGGDNGEFLDNDITNDNDYIPNEDECDHLYKGWWSRSVFMYGISKNSDEGIRYESIIIPNDNDAWISICVVNLLTSSISLAIKHDSASEVSI